MKRRSRRPFLSLLPLPLLAGWYLTTEPPQGGALERHVATVVTPARAPAATGSLYPPPQVDESSPPEDLPPTF